MKREVDKVKPKKNSRAIHSTRLIDDGDLIANVATPMIDKDDRELQVVDYQISTIDLGKHTQNQQISLLDLVATLAKSKMEKDKQAKDELKAQLGKMKRFLKNLTDSTPEQPTSSEVLVLMSRNEVDELNEMKRKAQMFDGSINILRKEIEELLDQGYKYYE